MASEPKNLPGQKENIKTSAKDDAPFIVREYRPSDWPGVLRLFEMQYHSYGPSWASPLDYWKWKHQNSPLKKNLIVVAEKRGNIIGVDCHTLLNVKVSDRIYTASYGGDLVVHPDFRRRGVANSIHNLLWALNKENGVKLHYGFAVNPIMIKHGLRYQEQLRKPFPHPVRFLWRIRNAGLHFRTNPNKLSWLLRFELEARRFKNNLRRNPIPENKVHGFKILQIHGFEDRIDKFWDAVSKHYTFMVERKKTFMNWRYGSLPPKEYTVKEAEDDGEILGYIVLRLSGDKNYPVGQIIDLLTLPNRLDIASSLIGNAMKYFDDREVNICNALVVQGHHYQRIFEKWGFVAARSKLQFSYVDNGLGEDFEKLRRSLPSQVHLCWGDGLGD